MGFPWQKMTVEEFAAFERSQGVKVVRTDGVYWRQVRPFFYRPLLATQEYVPRKVSPPPFALLGGFQHAVPAGASSNSFMNLLIFDDTKNYNMAGFSYGKRKRLKTALQRFAVRPIEDVKEFNESAYPVFLSFYERTHYSYKPERRESSNFSRWGESLFRFPKNLILGAYQDGRLQAVCISQWVEDVVIYASMFASTEALKLDATALMLHTVREAVAKAPEVRHILAGAFKYQEGGGVDNFFLERGCKLMSKPAVLSINPLAKALLKCCMAHQYEKMRGRIEDFPAAATNVDGDSAEAEGRSRQEKAAGNKAVAAPAPPKERTDFEARN